MAVKPASCELPLTDAMNPDVSPCNAIAAVFSFTEVYRLMAN